MVQATSLCTLPWEIKPVAGIALQRAKQRPSSLPKALFEADSPHNHTCTLQSKVGLHRCATRVLWAFFMWWEINPWILAKGLCGATHYARQEKSFSVFECPGLVV